MPPDPPEWSEWRPLVTPGVNRVEPSPPTGPVAALKFSPAVLAEVLDGGQAFGWHRASDGGWQGVWADCAARLKLSERDELRWSAPKSLAVKVAHELPRYLAADTDFAQLADRLPWRSDAHLARCIEAFPGLRLLRQPLAETLLCFLCSATKQIVQIKQMTAELARCHGRRICPAGSPSFTEAAKRGPDPAMAASNESAIHRLPTWPELAEISEKELRACRLGFRARHIRETARSLSRRPGWLEETGRRPYAEAKARLCELPGVGEKIADCVLLFAAGRLEAFPVDVWIFKAMAQRYGLAGWKPAQIAHFGRTHFGPLAGLAQQYLFAWERKFGRG
ncbi:MAG: DNA-binding protein [Verrucomicrobia bacterium RIFCSPLOWO2_12_FULL_64_8]|nr:MAG: DNA-binding protein [Verrucomicrobia bacterium RIFCSPLOWO2_12_FULL_64_8]